MADPAGKIWTMPVGTEIDVRLQTPLNSGTAKIEQRFEATTILDTTMGPDVVIPAGSMVRGFVSSVRAAGKIDRRGSLTLSFDELRIGERSFRLRASVTQALDGKMTQDVTRIGGVAAIGGIIGGILGGGKGALLRRAGRRRRHDGGDRRVQRRSAGRHDPAHPTRSAAAGNTINFGACRPTFLVARGDPLRSVRRGPTPGAWLKAAARAPCGFATPAYWAVYFS